METGYSTSFWRVKERASFYLVPTEPAEVSFLFVLPFKANASPIGSALLLSYRREKNLRHQTSLWRSLWKRDIPLHFGSEGKGFISFDADRTGGSLFSLCTSFESEFLAYRKYAFTVLPTREKSQTPDMQVAVVMETGYSTSFTFGVNEGRHFISNLRDRTERKSYFSCFVRDQIPPYPRVRIYCLHRKSRHRLMYRWEVVMRAICFIWRGERRRVILFWLARNRRKSHSSLCFISKSDSSPCSVFYCLTARRENLTLESSVSRTNLTENEDIPRSFGGVKSFILFGTDRTGRKSHFSLLP
ncbi:hypothetical protein AVEN_238910-1 [Araneus ventricosus]|uniref:Uncharacterized protein n=1 Tax=Araneus ventricosus TaxID=182803 RepID=A0A4Y2WJY1_ARAVE|nr:hypothetical protein AVEN_238910-1 [Araneus ventricosus]